MKVSKPESPTPGKSGFFSFLLQKQQKRELAIFAAAYLLLYIAVRICYPHILVTADTGSYILSAKTGIISGYRPIGYSWFLAFFHGLSPSMGFLFFCQFFLHAVGSLFLLFSIKYFFPPIKSWLFYLLAALVILEPNAMAIADLAMSDSVFNSLTLFFIAGLFWLNRGKSILNNALLLAFNLLMLYLAFEVRYAALFYPLLSAVALVLTAKKKWVGALLALLPVLVTVLAYNQTKKEMKKQFGKDTFSAFSGWAIANNAVSIIPYIDMQPGEFTDPNSRFIHAMVTQYPDSVYGEKPIMATSFMWTRELAGKQVLMQVLQQRPMPYVKGWVQTGVMMEKYGKTLISKYPSLYFRHFILPNAKRCFTHTAVYKTESYKPDALHKEWFELDEDVYPTQYDLFTAIDPLLMVLFYLRWLLFAAALVFMTVQIKKTGLTPSQKNILFTVLLFILGYIGLSITSHPINNFRYLIPLYAFMLLWPYVAINRYLAALGKTDTPNPK